MVEQHFKLEKGELTQIANVVRPIFHEHMSRYDFEKYPAAVLLDLRARFTSGHIDANAISRALKWKWGHWSKPNIPEAHKSLIRETQGSCDGFNRRPGKPGSQQTFLFWAAELGGHRRYITRAFLTHLQHPQEIAIIDQHNWRAMRRLLEDIPRARKLRTAPRDYLDLLGISDFCRSLSTALRESTENVDHFLMQFGRSIKQTSRPTASPRSRSTPPPSPHPR